MPAIVRLNIYDVSTQSLISKVNAYLQPIGTGVFHGAVEVYGTEWSYGYTTQGSGVFTSVPRGCSAHRFRESVVLGTTQCSEAEVMQMIDTMKGIWHGKDYDLLRRNCCYFCDEFAVRLGVGNIPVWVTNLAAAGATIQDGVLGIVVAGQAAAIVAAAKAGQIDSRYNIRGATRAQAREFLDAIRNFDRIFRIKETATDVVANATVGVVKAAHEAMTTANEGARFDPDAVGLDSPTSRGGAANAASDINKLIGRTFSCLCSDERRHCW